MWASVGSMGISFKVQSLKSPAFVEERIEAFITLYRNTLSSIELDSFNSRRNALVDRLLEKPKNLAEEAALFWQHIDGGYCDFSRGQSESPSAYLDTTFLLTDLLRRCHRRLHNSRPDTA